MGRVHVELALAVKVVCDVAGFGLVHPTGEAQAGRLKALSWREALEVRLEEATFEAIAAHAQGSVAGTDARDRLGRVASYGE
jgi:hypothetical protein